MNSSRAAKGAAAIGGSNNNNKVTIATTNNKNSSTSTYNPLHTVNADDRPPEEVNEKPSRWRWWQRGKSQKQVQSGVERWEDLDVHDRDRVAPIVPAEESSCCSCCRPCTRSIRRTFTFS
jgi:hypothetical protein